MPKPGAGSLGANIAVAWGTGQLPTGAAHLLPGWLHLRTDAAAHEPEPGAPKQRGPVPVGQSGPHGAG